MVGRNELIEWLQTFPESEDFAIDEGGLTIVPLYTEGYIEIGVMPFEDDGVISK